MAKTEPESTPDERPESSPGRFGSALQVLRGQSLVPDQIRWEWLEYQHQFNDLLQRYSATLARAAKSEKKRIADLSDHLERPEPHAMPSKGDHKADLRARAAALRGLGVASGPQQEAP